MLLVSSYEPACSCVAARCGSSQYPQFDPCSPQSLQQLSGRASDQITEGRGFKSHLGLGFFPSLCVSQHLHNIILFWRGLYSEGFSKKGNFHFQINWASLILASKFTIFALFYFVYEGNLPSTSSPWLILGRAM